MKALFILILSITSLDNKTTTITTVGGFKTEAACVYGSKIMTSMIGRATWKQGINQNVQYVCMSDNENSESFAITRQLYLP